MENPFGTNISSQDILESLNFFDDWEQRYSYIIELGRELPPMAEDKKTEKNIVRGCQSQVWLDYEIIDGKVHLQADSDAFIVKGLLGLILAAYNNKTLDQINEFDIDQYFLDLGLEKHLSPIRGNGLKAMVAKIKSFN